MKRRPIVSFSAAIPAENLESGMAVRAEPFSVAVESTPAKSVAANSMASTTLGESVYNVVMSEGLT